MAVDVKTLVKVLKEKREKQGLSLRALSSIIGVSFSSLARIERGEGEPDNNSMIRILEWLGEEGRDSGLTFENVALVHFRAAKNASSKTIHCLLQAADSIKSDYSDAGSSSNSSNSREIQKGTPPDPVSLSKPELEAMAIQMRADLKIDEDAPLDALSIEIEDVKVFTPGELPKLDKTCHSYLTLEGSNDWSAMSVPLNVEQSHWAIIRNDTHTIERQRVTYLEECWHILLDHKLTKIAKVSDSYGRTYDSSEEHDAYYLAAATLLPESAVNKAVEQGKTAVAIGKMFGTSPELAEYRIKRLGLWLSYKGKSVSFGNH